MKQLTAVLALRIGDHPIQGMPRRANKAPHIVKREANHVSKEKRIDALHELTRTDILLREFVIGGS